MLELKIDQLRLHFEGATGQEHRVGPIAERAMVLLAERLHERVGTSRTPGRQEVDDLHVPSLQLNLNGTSDGAAADAIANALLTALALKLGV